MAREPHFHETAHKGLVPADQLGTGGDGSGLHYLGDDQAFHAVPESAGAHEHMIETFNGDGATTAFEIANEPLDPEAVAGYAAGLLVAVTVSGVMSTTVTFAAAPASGTANVVIQYPALAA